MTTLFVTLPIFLGVWLKDESISGYADRDTVFVLHELNGAAFSARATIAFPSRGAIAGEGPCNRFSADQTLPYPWFAVERLSATRRICPEHAQENAYFTALQTMTLAEVSPNVLILSNDAGGEMVFLISP